MEEVKDTVRSLRRCGTGLGRKALLDGCLVSSKVLVVVFITVFSVLYI